jgi:hypothetical protein
MDNDVISFDVVTEDMGGLTATATVTVFVEDVNDNRPVFEKDVYNLEMMSNAAIATSVGVIRCTDKDVGECLNRWMVRAK